jgi:hypothetical protein
LGAVGHLVETTPRGQEYLRSHVLGIGAIHPAKRIPQNGPILVDKQLTKSLLTIVVSRLVPAVR